MPLGTKTFHRTSATSGEQSHQAFWEAPKVRLNLPPFFVVKESDFIFHILYQCIICTNSRSIPVGKHSDETAPTPLERGFAETAPHHAIHLGVTSQFFLQTSHRPLILHTNYFYYYLNVRRKVKTRVHLYLNITPEREKASSNRSLYVAE